MNSGIDWNNFWFVNSSLKMFVWKFYERYRSKAYIKLLKNINLDNKTMVELGGGSGYLLGLISLQKNTKAFVVDNSEEAYQTYKKSGIKFGVKYVKEDLFNYKKKYDIVMSDGVIEHFQKIKRQKAISVHKKLMKDNGLCVIFVPKDSWFVKTFLSMKGGYEKKFTSDELKKEVEKSGLRTIGTISDIHMTGILCESK
ncbi:MAG: methyltransferase domain-containing protein [Nanoarchaeota archaeon]|nr:methyltransferase domain-containing protein [Nanoarchaeota archaeon]MBU4124370.1 methyltransferase domain-containing protein [Nanoarchaeota archaeon]